MRVPAPARASVHLLAPGDRAQICSWRRLAQRPVAGRSPNWALDTSRPGPNKGRPHACRMSKGLLWQGEVDAAGSQHPALRDRSTICDELDRRAFEDTPKKAYGGKA